MRIPFSQLISLGITFITVASTASAQDLSTGTPSTDLPAKKQECAADQPKDPALWNRSLSAGFSYTDGNSNTSSLNISAALSRDYEDNIWDFGANYIYGESDEGADDGSRETTKNEVLAKAGYKRLITDTWFTGLGGSFRYDEIADIDYRVLLNPTIGNFLVREDEVKFSLETGPSYVFEKVSNIEDDYFAPRVADNFEWKLGPTSKVFQSAEALFDINDSENYIINAELGVESSLNSFLSLVLVIRDNYDNQPGVGNERNDVALITALKVLL